MKRFLVTFLVFLLSAQATLALEITKIGNSDVTSQSFSKWTYSSENPTFMGTGTANTTVTLNINNSNYTTDVDATGNWTYSPTVLTAGTHSMIVSNDGSQMTFTMEILGANTTITPTPTSATGTSPTPTPSATDMPDELPQSGNTPVMMLVVGGAMIMMGGGLFLTRRYYFEVVE